MDGRDSQVPGAGAYTGGARASLSITGERIERERKGIYGRGGEECTKFR